MLTVKKHGEGKCLWCAKDTEGVEVEFQDGSLRGFLCRSDFWRLLKQRSGHKNGNGKKPATLVKS